MAAEPYGLLDHEIAEVVEFYATETEAERDLSVILGDEHAEIRQDDSDAYRDDYRRFLTTLTDEQLAYLIELGRDAEPEGGSEAGPVAELPAAT